MPILRRLRSIRENSIRKRTVNKSRRLISGIDARRQILNQARINLEARINLLNLKLAGFSASGKKGRIANWQLRKSQAQLQLVKRQIGSLTNERLLANQALRGLGETVIRAPSARPLARPAIRRARAPARAPAARPRVAATRKAATRRTTARKKAATGRTPARKKRKTTKKAIRKKKKR